MGAETVPDFDALLEANSPGRPGTLSLIDGLLEDMEETNRAKVLAALHAPTKNFGNGQVANALTALTGTKVNDQHVRRWRKAHRG